MSQYGAASSEERSLKDLISEMTGELRLLVTKEMELAKTELKQTVSQATKAGTMLAVTAFTGFLAVVMLSFAAAWGLAEVMAPGLGFLVVAAVYLVVAAVAFGAGRRKLSALKPAPEQTLATLKQDVQVAKDSLSRGAAGSLQSRPPAVGSGRRA